MSFIKMIGLVVIFAIISAIALLLLSVFVPGFSVLSLSGWLIYVVGGVLVFLAFLRRHSSGKSSGPVSQVAKTQASDANIETIEEVRSRVRSMKRERGRSSEK